MLSSRHAWRTGWIWQFHGSCNYEEPSVVEVRLGLEGNAERPEDAVLPSLAPPPL